MIKDHKVYYDGGDQTITTVPVDREGRPTVVSSATYAIFQENLASGDSDRTVQASGAATVDSFSTTTDAAAGPGSTSRTVSVADATGGSENTHYIISEADGRRELFLTDGVDTTGDNLYLRHGLGRNFSSGATVKGCEVSGTFPSAEAADEENVKRGGGPYRVAWTWTLDGVSETVNETIWIVRQPSSILVTSEDVLRGFPTLKERFGERFSVEPLIAEATADADSMLALHGRDNDYERSPELLRAIVWRARWYAFVNFPTERDEDQRDLCHQEWERFASAITMGTQPLHTVKVDRANDTAKSGTVRTYAHRQTLS